MLVEVDKTTYLLYFGFWHFCLMLFFHCTSATNDSPKVSCLILKSFVLGKFWILFLHRWWIRTLIVYLRVSYSLILRRLWKIRWCRWWNYAGWNIGSTRNMWLWARITGCVCTRDRLFFPFSRFLKNITLENRFVQLTRETFLVLDH